MPLGHRASYISAAVNLKLIIVGIGIHVNNDGGTGDHRNPLATGEQFTEPCPDGAASVRLKSMVLVSIATWLQAKRQRTKDPTYHEE